MAKKKKLPSKLNVTMSSEIIHPAENPKIRLKNISFIYSAGTPFEMKALDDVSLDIHPGKLTAEERRAVLEEAAKQFVRSLQKQGKEGVLIGKT